MTEFLIKDEDLTSLKGKVVVLTGGSSGIGLGVVDLLLSLGAKVVSGDIQQPPTTGDFLFVKTDVRNWVDLCALFKKAKEQHGRIDYVFANAGIAPKANYLELETDSDGELVRPTSDTIDINQMGVIHTGALAVHYFKQQAEGGSLVVMASSTGLHPVRGVDYSSSKHGALGFGRGMAKLVEVAGLPIRVNTLMPSWTATQVLPDIASLLTMVSHRSQSTSVVARAAAYLMADTMRNGDVIFISDGKYTEIDKSILLPAYDTIKGESPSDDEILGRLLAL